MHEPYKNNDISCKNTFGVEKVWSNKVESYIPGSECTNRLATTRSDIKIQPRLSLLNTLILHWIHYN